MYISPVLVNYTSLQKAKESEHQMGAHSKNVSLIPLLFLALHGVPCIDGNICRPVSLTDFAVATPALVFPS